uniref:Putative secreted protein n=1 Tax=Anopheles marajoara TaxID=58244 RepID=A0A2M4C9V1_9DIPT
MAIVVVLLAVFLPLRVPHVRSTEARFTGRCLDTGTLWFSNCHLCVPLTLWAFHAHKLTARLWTTGAEQSKGHPLRNLRAKTGLPGIVDPL